MNAEERTRLLALLRERALDAVDEAFYRPIIERLKKMADEAERTE